MAKVILGELRHSYCRLDEPYDRNNDGNLKYSDTLLIPKSDAALVAKLKEAVDQAAREALNKKFGGKMPAKLASPVHDGDGVKENGEPYGPECAGHYVLTATTRADNPPGLVVGPERRQAEPGEIYSGCYGYVSVNFAGYNYNGRKGVGAYLNNVWKTRDGEQLGGRTRAQDDFAGITIEGTPQDDFAGFSFDMDDELPF